jgi:SAM-dependent methyltransferase
VAISEANRIQIPGLKKGILHKLLALPGPTENYDLDDPRLTEARRDIILGKPFLKNLYVEWYNDLKKRLEKAPKGKVVEIGSGAGFFKQVMPEILTSDIMPLSYTDYTFSAENMPFSNGELSGIAMVDVMHHIPKPELFFKEAIRTLKPGGRIVMIEPANSWWGRFIFKTFHHEPFDQKAGWELASSGPLSGANIALPWIIFVRDKKRFEEQYPKLKIVEVVNHTALRYLISGGVSLKALVPSWSFGFFRLIEKILSPASNIFSMFMTVEIERV